MLNKLLNDFVNFPICKLIIIPVNLRVSLLLFDRQRPQSVPLKFTPSPRLGKIRKEREELLALESC